jgi:hypothetical protein
MSNPKLKLNFMDDQACADFILEHFGQDIYQTYLSFPQAIMRADFWRVAVVYIYGGYYADLDVDCRVDINELFNPQVDAVFIKELDNIANFFFGAVPKHPVLKMALDYMLAEAPYINNITSQSFGMHNFHRSVREYYAVQGINYINNNSVEFLNNEQLKHDRKLMHMGASGFEYLPGYESWRHKEKAMMDQRFESNDVLFFTTFNKNGYDLYGKEWIASFIAVANYYNKFRAKIYYEGFAPSKSHPSIEWIKYEEAVPAHPKWKADYLAKTTHPDYVKTMTVRFSHKAFVIQHSLDNNANDYVIWLDGDCVFKNSDYREFPKNILGDKFLACQVEHNHDLNHVESGILIFNSKHSDTAKFNQEFKKWYSVEHVLKMGQPYDGFIVFKSLLTSGLKYVDLNAAFSSGIQSDPEMTFLHPEIKSKFIHNIGWTGKNQYDNWQKVFLRDDIYKQMKTVLFGRHNSAEMQAKKETALTKLEKLRKAKLR